MYLLSNGRINIAKRQFTQIRNHYCLVFDKTAVVTEVANDKDILTFAFSFHDLNDVAEFMEETLIDTIGVILEVEDATLINTKYGEQYRRVFTIGDHTNHSLSVTLWGEQAQTFKAKPG